MSLCQYKDILGKPGKGIHSYRLFGFAIADLIMTVIAAYIIAYMFKIQFRYSLGGLFILGIVLHRAFCVKTTLDKLLFGDY
jgi:hypothetical protein